MLFPLHISKVGIAAWSPACSQRWQIKVLQRWKSQLAENPQPAQFTTCTYVFIPRALAESPAKTLVKPNAAEHQRNDSVCFLEGTCSSSPAFQHVPAAAFPEHGQLGIAVPKDPPWKRLKAKAIKVQGREQSVQSAVELGKLLWILWVIPENVGRRHNSLLEPSEVRGKLFLISASFG